MGLTIIGVGTSYIKIDIKKESYSGIVIDSHPNYFLLLSGGERLYSYYKNNEYEIGDYLKITGQKEGGTPARSAPFCLSEYFTVRS